MQNRPSRTPAEEELLDTSFGVATFPLHGNSTIEVMKRADEALYVAKQRGGDEIAAFAH